MTPARRAAAHSHLFTVRLWCEKLGSGQMEWRGQVTHVLSGEAHWFRGWTELEAHLAAAVLQREQADEVQTPAAKTT